MSFYTRDGLLYYVEMVKYSRHYVWEVWHGNRVVNTDFGYLEIK